MKSPLKLTKQFITISKYDAIKITNHVNLNYWQLAYTYKDLKIESNSITPQLKSLQTFYAMPIDVFPRKF